MANKINIYLKGKLYMTCCNEFVALNNVVNLRKQYGEENVTVEFEKGGKVGK